MLTALLLIFGGSHPATSTLGRMAARRRRVRRHPLLAAELGGASGPTGRSVGPSTRQSGGRTPGEKRSEPDHDQPDPASGEAYQDAPARWPTKTPPPPVLPSSRPAAPGYPAAAMLDWESNRRVRSMA